MADQTLSALRELTEAVMAEFFGNDTNLSKRLIKATNEAQLLLMVQPPDDGRVNHFPGATEMVAPPAEGEAGGLVADLEVAAASYFNRRFVADARRCRRAADLLQQQAAELAECREALRRVRRWGSTFGSPYSSAVAMGVMDWIDAGMTGPLPAMPEYLEGRPNG